MNEIGTELKIEHDSIQRSFNGFIRLVLFCIFTADCCTFPCCNTYVIQQAAVNTDVNTVAFCKNYSPISSRVYFPFFNFTARASAVTVTVLKRFKACKKNYP